jgi:hypothetical protein
LIWHGDDRVTLEAHNGQYVCAEPDGCKRIAGDSQRDGSG